MPLDPHVGRRVAAWLFLALAAGTVPSSAAGEGGREAAGMPPMRVFASRETGVRTMAWSAAQDRQGVMYFGCDSVVSFDGDRWRTERMDPTYAIRGLDVGPNGRIWIAGVNQIGWFEPGARGKLEYHSLMPRLPAGGGDLGDVWRVYAEGADGAVFVARSRVLRWDGRQFTSWALPGMHLLWSTRTAKAIYVHYPPVGLLRIGPEGPVVVEPASVLGTADIRWLDDSGEDWLLLRSEGFSSLRDGVCTRLDTGASAYVRANTPTSAARLRDGSLAVGTLLGGIVVADRSGNVVRILNRQAGLPANQVYSLLVDREGAIWAMGPANIVRISVGSGIAVFGPQLGYPPGGCDSLAEFAGATYLAAHSDILRLDPAGAPGSPGQFSTIGITSSRFYSLLSAGAGLVVGHVHGLGLWTPAGMKPLIQSDDIVLRTAASRSRPESVLAAQYNRVLSVDLGTGKTRVVADSLPDYGDTLIDEPSGRLWIGTQSRGLFVAEPGNPHSVQAAARFGPLPTSGPTYVTLAGERVVALASGAAYFLDPKGDRFLRVAGVPEGSPSAISNSDASGSVWAAMDPPVGANSPKLGRITFTPQGALWTPRSIEGLSGIGSLLGLYVVSVPGGQALWIVGSDSLVRAGPSALAARPPPPRPMISASYVAGDGSGGSGIEGELPYSTRRIHIEYSSLDYGMRETERFQTMLSGAETEWSPETETAQVDLSGLREGSYDFMVRLVADSGQAGEPADLHFVIAPPWWRTLAARALFVLSGAAAILGFLRLRVSSLRRRALILEEMVRQRTQEYEKANAAKTEFVASMSHEIRNPMGGILGSALELSGTPMSPDQRELVSTLRTCATFLASLVEDVLDFAAIEAGAYTVSRSPFGPRAVLDAVLKMLEPRSGEARMEVVVDPDLPPRILGDAARVQQVLVNFAVNSLKFGGKKVTLSATAANGDVVFSVADDGPGIPLEEQKNLFIRFSRLKSAPNTAIPGTGLGLATSRALAERMGGSVGVSSAPGRGSTFYLRLPVEVAAEAEAAPQNPRGAGGRALVVEDIDYNARALALMVGRFGFEVDIASDGEEALARLAQGAYGTIFLDCDLPKLSGLDVARSLRSSEVAGKRTLIIATTAHSTVADQRACLAAGMDAFLSKPITPEKLRAVLAAGMAHQDAPPAAAGPAGIDLTLIRHLSDRSPEGMRRELGKFTRSLDEALRGLDAAHASGSRSGISSAAHRVISHARMVGASDLAQAAVDLQDFAAVYSESELSGEIATLSQRAANLKEALGRMPEAAEMAACPDGQDG